MSTPSTPTRIDRLFDKLKALYGSQFLLQWKDVNHDDVNRIWKAALENFSNDVLADALGGVLASCPDFPPSLPKFVSLCTEAHARRNPPKKPEQFALPAPDTSEENKAKRLAAADKLRTIGKHEPSLAWARIRRKKHESGEHILTPEELAIVANALRFEPVEVAA